jgi:uncharacterized RDD family membrane protein YckC
VADSAVTIGVPLLVAQLVVFVTSVGVAAAVRVTVALAFTLGYHIWFETRGLGRTPGKKLAGLRVVDDRGLPLTLQQSLVRNVVRALDLAPAFYGIGAITCLVDSRSRRLGDIAARTMVIEEHPPALAALPSKSLSRQSGLETPRMVRLIRHRIGLEDRELLFDVVLRIEKLPQETAYQLMEELGRHYRRVLDFDDPTLSHENFVRSLAAVISARAGDLKLR